jgi:DNA polymerase-1
VPKNEPENEIEDAKNLIKYEMENALCLTVPLKVDVGFGKNWAEVH